MNDKSSTEKKIEGRVLTAFFYTVFILYSVIAFAFQSLSSSVILGTSKILFDLIFIAIPIVILILPFALNLITNKDFGECVKNTITISLVYIMLSVGMNTGLKMYFKDFSPDKWKIFPQNRYLMIDELQNEYSLEGTNISDIQNLLGEGREDIFEGDKKALMYGVKRGFWTDEYFVMYYDDDGIVTETHIKKLTESAF